MLWFTKRYPTTAIWFQVEDDSDIMYIAMLASTYDCSVINIHPETIPHPVFRIWIECLDDSKDAVSDIIERELKNVPTFKSWRSKKQ